VFHLDFLERQGTDCDAGIVDQDIGAPKPLDALGSTGRDLFGQGVVAQRFDLCNKLSQARLTVTSVTTMSAPSSASRRAKA
jgi:hypothetical protein